MDELTEMALLTQLSEMVLTEAFSPQGINIGMNLGRPAGAGIVDHLHTHSGAALERRHQLHDGGRRSARAAGRVATDS